MDLSLLNIKRFYLKVFFLLSGLLFASWASRIPTIKTVLQLNDVQLGTLLFILPFGSLVGLPLSGFLVSKFNTKELVLYSFLLQLTGLICIGLSPNIYLLGFSLFLFAFAIRIANIAINTQSVNLQKFFETPILGRFHGLWSVGGIFGAGLSSLLLIFDVNIKPHYIAVSIFALIATLFSYPKLLGNDKADKGNKIIFGKPDPFLMRLGLLTFFAAICEGGMFDWSGIYFKEVLEVPIFTYGYFTFLIFMAIFRFASDKMVKKIGAPKNYIISTVLIISGITLAISFPYFWNGIIGFALVGMGTAPIFPMTLGLAGKSAKYSVGMGISIISTYTIVGMLLGPPIIGYLSHLFNLRVAFILFAFAGFMFTPISKSLFKMKI